MVDGEPLQSLGGQAFWSFGGLFLVDSPEQRRLRVRDSVELALADWLGSAAFDRPEDHWPRRWAEAYVHFAAGEKRSWLQGLGVRWFPLVQWAERGGYTVPGHGNSVPRFHVTWGTGPGIVQPFADAVLASHRVRIRSRHKVSSIEVGADGARVHGSVLEPSEAPRGVAGPSSAVGEFSFAAHAVVIAGGGIGGNADLVRQNWPRGHGEPPRSMIAGVPDYVDGSMIEVATRAGGRVINPDVVEGQIAGGVAQGIGGVLLEHSAYDDQGNPLNVTFVDYLLPTATDVPTIEYGHIEIPGPGVGGYKGVGEGGAIGSSAAVINAINDALAPLGVTLTRLPASPAAIVELLEQGAEVRTETWN